MLVSVITFVVAFLLGLTAIRVLARNKFQL
jgi:hypothetical protein